MKMVCLSSNSLVQPSAQLLGDFHCVRDACHDCERYFEMTRIVRVVNADVFDVVVSNLHFISEVGRPTTQL